MPDLNEGFGKECLERITLVFIKRYPYISELSTEFVFDSYPRVDDAYFCF